MIPKAKQSNAYSESCERISASRQVVTKPIFIKHNKFTGVTLWYNEQSLSSTQAEINPIMNEYNRF